MAGKYTIEREWCKQNPNMVLFITETIGAQIMNNQVAKVSFCVGIGGNDVFNDWLNGDMAEDFVYDNDISVFRIRCVPGNYQ